MYKNDQVIRRYSEGFKLKILTELSAGRYSKRELSRIYGLQSSTVNEWIKKYDRQDLMNTRIMIENHDEITRVKALQKKDCSIKEVVAKKDLEQLVNDSYLKTIAELHGYRNGCVIKKVKHASLMQTIARSGNISIEKVGKSYDLKRGVVM
jgi:transposase-like protein